MKSLTRTTSLFLLLSLTSGLLLSSVSLVQAQSASEGYTLLNRGWVNDAIAAFQRALRNNPNSLDARLGLAIAYQKAGQDSKAWQAYQQVLKQDPKNRTALKAVGMLGSYRAEWQPAGINALTTLLQLTPNDTAARAQRALLYGYQGRFAEAIADYQPLLQGNPQPETLLGAAQVYTYSGNYTQGLALFERYRATGRTIPDSAITAYAQTLRQTGKVEQAIQVLETRLSQRKQLDATAIDLRTALAVAYQANNQPDRAAAVLAELRNRPEATLPLARSLSAIARQSGDAALYEEAIDLYRQALQRSSSAPLMIEAADVLSESATHRSEAFQLYQQALQDQPDNAPLKIKHLILARQLGQVSRSKLVQEIQALLQPLPASVAERQLLAQALLQLDPPEPQLLSVYQELVQSGVDSPFLNFRIAQILVQKGEFAAARQALAAYSGTAIGSQDLATELLLAEIERQENQLDASAQRYESLISRSQSNGVRIAALRGLAGIRQSQGRLDDAIQIYDQILSQNPRAAWAQLGKASLEYQAKRLSVAEAETILNQWMEAHPGEAPPELYSLVGVLPPDAKREALYKTLLEIEPDNLAIQRRLIQVVAMRDPQLARSQVNALLQRDPNNLTAYFIKGELAQTLGNLDEAAQAYEAILQRQPNNIDALLGLGGVSFQQQRYSEATRIYNRVVALRPNDWDIRRILAELSLAQDQKLAALRLFKQAEQMQKEQGVSDRALADRLERVQVDYLRRRGFQPDWERY